MISIKTRWGLLPVVLVAALAIASCKGKTEQPSTDEPAKPAEPTKAAKAPELVLPTQFPEMVIPDDNPQTPEKIALGHKLFFDKRLSVDGSRSCYSCHQNEHGNGGEVALAVGAKEKQLTRHSPVMWNVGFFQALYWDGRAPSLEAQATGAWAGGNMGVGKENLGKKVAELSKIAAYKEEFAKAFPDKGMTPETVVQAISAYERTLVCNETAYDKFANGDKSALSDKQQEGLRLFMGKAQCVACHAPPLFSAAMGIPDGMYYNIGIGTQGVAEDAVDVGRSKVSERPEDWAAFKIPSLRNVGKSAPYFHDGSVASLDEAVKLMSSGGIDNKNKTKIMFDRKLTDDERGLVVEFLGALDCPGGLEEPPLP